MAKLGWLGSVALAAGASAGAAAAQFGLGYGLGIIAWSPLAATGPQTTDTVWLSSLAWTTWIAATSTVVGAICADRRSLGEIGSAPPRPVAGAPATPPTILATAIWRVLLAVSAAVGALLSVALVLVPAQAAIRADTSTPQLIAAGYAVVGIIVGIVVAVGALVVRAGATNVITTAAWLWVLAVAAVIDGVANGRGLGTAPLASWPFGGGTYFRSTWSLPDALLMLGAAFVIGIGAAWPSMWRRGLRSRAPQGAFGPASLSGAFGPLVVAVAYLLTAPHLVGLDDPQVSAFLLAPYALIAGLAGSVLLVAALAGRGTGTGTVPTAQPVGVPTAPPMGVPAYRSPLRRLRPSSRRAGSESGDDTTPSALPAPRSGSAPRTGSVPRTGSTPRSETTPRSGSGPQSGSAPARTSAGPAVGVATSDDDADTLQLRPAGSSTSNSNRSGAGSRGATAAPTGTASPAGSASQSGSPAQTGSSAQTGSATQTDAVSRTGSGPRAGSRAKAAPKEPILPLTRPPGKPVPGTESQVTTDGSVGMSATDAGTGDDGLGDDPTVADRSSSKTTRRPRR
jgi:hypothetical protein